VFLGREVYRVESVRLFMGHIGDARSARGCLGPRQVAAGEGQYRGSRLVEEDRSLGVCRGIAEPVFFFSLASKSSSDGP
jgi:hypothetical protein